MKTLRAIIPAAGKGSRLQSISGDVPKAMVPVQNTPMLEIVLENIGFIEEDDIYIVVGCGKEKITGHFGDRFHYVEQKEQLGTGHAVRVCTEEFEGFEGDVLVTFGDMPLFRREELEAMCKQHDENNADCTMMTAENPDLKMWARVVRDDEGRFFKIVEGKDCNKEQEKIKELFSGVMVFDSKALFEILPEMSRENAQKEYYITEIPELMVKKNLTVDTYFNKDGDDLRGINSPEDLGICEEILKKRQLVSVG